MATKPASEPASEPALRLAHADDEPIIFYGPPGSVRGTVRLHNRSTEKVKLSAIALDFPKLRGPAREPLDSLSMLARVYPNQQAQVPAVLNIDPSTPPGTYDGSLQVGERWQRVRVHITEHIDLRVQPRSVSIFTEGELVFPREFVVENAGNVPLRLGDDCIVPLGDALELRAAVRQGLRDACGASKGEDVLKSLLCAWSDQQVGTMSVKREDVTLQPGEARPLTLTFTLPSDLRRFRRYVADLPLYTASLHLEVVTGDLRSTDVRSEQRSQS